MTLTLIAGTTLDDGLSEPLTMDEKQQRRKAESAIRKALDLEVRANASYVASGKAFREIRDCKLYRDTHPSIEKYSKERWQVGKSHLYRLISASEVADVLSPIGDVPAKESIARELVPMLDNPERLACAWEQAVQDAEDHGNRKITANWLKRWLDHSLALQGTPTPSQILNHSGKPAAHKPAPKPSTPGDDLLGTPSATVPVMDEDPWLYVLAALDVANGKPAPGTLRPPLSDARRKMLLRSLRKAVSILERDTSEVIDPDE